MKTIEILKILKFWPILILTFSCTTEIESPEKILAQLQGSSSSSSSFEQSSSSSDGSSSSSEQSSPSGPCAGFVNGKTRPHQGKDKPQFCDERDGQKYVYVTIGEGATAQVWMAENLNYVVDGSLCYGDNTGGDSQNNCGTYGRLYNWATAMDNSFSSITSPSGVQGICPSGWHIPSEDEWTTLVNYVNGPSQGNCTCAGTRLKANSDLWSPNAGTDNHGFSALPGGTGNHSFGEYGYWWSSTENNNATEARYRNIGNYNPVNMNWGNDLKIRLFSVRCVQN